jgi:hypothetical protein
MPWSVIAATGWAGTNGGGSNPINAVGSTLAMLVVASGAGGSMAFTITGGEPWQLVAMPEISGNRLSVYLNLTPPQVPSLQVIVSGTDCRMRAWVVTYTGERPVLGTVVQATSNDVGVTLPAVLVLPSALLLTATQHQSPNTPTVSFPSLPPTQASGGGGYIAGAQQGLVANIPQTSGVLVPTWLTAPPLIAPMAAAAVVINVALPGLFLGVGPIANLPGKVTATNALDISTTAALDDETRTGHLDGTTKYTEAVLIPAPASDAQVIVTALSASALVAGAFSVRYRTGPTAVLGPIWLPSSGAAALVTGRTFESGPILRALPPGQGLTVTTSVDAPQSFEATYQIVSVG